MRINSGSSRKGDSQNSSRSRHGEETSYRAQENKLCGKASLLIAVPLIISLAVAGASVYSGFRVFARLNDLSDSVRVLLDKQSVTAIARIASDAKSPTLEQPKSLEQASTQSRDLMSNNYEQIEQQLAALAKRVEDLTSQLQMLARRPSAQSRSATIPPSLPDTFATGYTAADQMTLAETNGEWQSAVTDESRIEANEVLRDYAERAREEIQALHEAGNLDRAAMERIKQTTRAQAASELQHRLPTDAYDEIFPEALEGSAMRRAFDGR